jgi:hypothetical protein
MSDVEERLHFFTIAVAVGVGQHQQFRLSTRLSQHFFFHPPFVSPG